MSEFSRRVDVEVFKDEQQSRDEYAERQGCCPSSVRCPVCDGSYAYYLEHFQPYWWHAQSPNGEILTNGEHYANEVGAINSIEVLFGDDTTMQWARMYGEDRGFKWLRYGKTDRDAQAAG